MKNSLYFIILFTLAFMISSCHKDTTTLVNTDTETDVQSFVEANYNGVVVDVYGQPLLDALVKIGNSTTKTDQNGFFTLTAIVNKKGAALKVSKEGYFNGLGNLTINHSKDNFFRISLQERILTSTINSSIGGIVKYGDHQVTLAANSFILESNEAYNGEVEVYMAYLDPTASNFSDLMPGDMLVGDDSQRQPEILKSYGMLHVELNTPMGEKLQINQTASLQLSIPIDLMSTAPDVIPLWYFDEDSGLWIEEGKAIKEGNKYMGNVEHFTLWNCDESVGVINFSGEIISRSTLKNIELWVTSEVLNETRKVFTNANGVFSGKVPENDNLLIEIFNNCDELVYSRSVQTSTEPLHEEFFVDLTNIDLITLSGYVTDCNGTHLSHAYVIINDGSVHGSTIYQCNNDGFIQVDFYKCTDEDIQVTVVDLNTNLQSSEIFSLSSNHINIGNLEACGSEIVSKIVFNLGVELKTFYFVTADIVGNAPSAYTFEYALPFPDGSSYTAEHKLEFDAIDGWSIRNGFPNVVGSPTFAYSIISNGLVDFINETDDYIDIEFPKATVYDNVSNQVVTEEGRVYIKAVK